MKNPSWRGVVSQVLVMRVSCVLSGYQQQDLADDQGHKDADQDPYSSAVMYPL